MEGMDQEQLQARLRDFHTVFNNLEGLAVIRLDGLVAASTMPGEIVMEQPAVVAGSMAALAKRTLEELKQNQPGSLTMRFSDGWAVCMLPVGEVATLLILLQARFSDPGAWLKLHHMADELVALL
jgi:predicted regulator of Ras-like GTPase activity (Roadblock/LC7/MglB family)